MRVVFMAVVCVMVFTAISEAQVTPNNLRVVAYSGESAPGGGTFGTNLGYFDGGTGSTGPIDVQIDDSGRVLFGDQTDGKGVYFENPAGTLVYLAPVLSSGSPAYYENSSVLSRGGTIAADMDAVYPHTPDLSVQLTSGSGWSSTGATAGPGNFSNSDSFLPTIASTGSFAFEGVDLTATGGAFRDALYVVRNPASPTTYSQVAHGGSNAPDASGSGVLPIGVRYFSTERASIPAINASSNIAFTATLSNSSGSGGSLSSGIFKETGTGHTLVNVAYGSNTATTGIAGMSAPGLQYSSSGLHPTTGTFSTVGNVDSLHGDHFDNVAFNNAGQVVFRGTLNDTGNIGSGNDQGIWTDAPGSLTIVAQTGTTPIPTVGGTFTHFDPAVINGNGRITFTAASGISTGIFSRSPDSAPTSPGTLTTIAFSGQHPIPNYTYTTVAPHSGSFNIPSFDINGVDQSAIFLADLSHTGDPNPEQAIMSVDPYGNVVPVVLTGVSSIRSSTVSSIELNNTWISGGQDGFGSALNSAGYFSFTAQLADGSSVVATSRIALAGDANGDGIVNGLDSALISSNWLHTGAPGIPGDVNFDGIVNGLDSALVSSTWFHTIDGTGAGGAPVPEPATWLTAVIGAMALGLVRVTRAHLRRRVHPGSVDAA